jgi:NAD(P)H-hydrate epimerase
MKLVTAAQMRELEKRADANGNAFAAMMERAGSLTAQAIIKRWSVQGKRVLVLIGPGNNGGDGLVCARALHDAGAQVQLYVWKRAPHDDVNLRTCRERGIEFARAEEDADFARLKAKLARTDFIVDAFLGTGVTRPIEGLLNEILDTVRMQLESKRQADSDLISPSHPHLHTSTHPYIIAVDLPTGLNPDTGALDPTALSADLTVTFAFPKVGQYTFPGADAVGELVVADIGIRREWASDIPLDVATSEEIRARLPPRPRDSNKGTFGKAMLVGGSSEFTGAPTLAASAAGRVGAGLVTLAVPRGIHHIVAAKLNEATYLPLPDARGTLTSRAVTPLVSIAQDYDAMLVGCGFGRARETQQFVKRLFGSGATTRKSKLPSVVIDADALNALAETKDWWSRGRFSAPPILTPHPGEMARLIGASVGEVQKDRVGIARKYAREWNAIVVLKGAFTVIATPNGSATLIPFATAALATAGTGDVLAGTIAGFLAQFRAQARKAAHSRANVEDGATDSFNAAVVGAYVHGLAGDFIAREIGVAGTVAGDLIPRLPEATRVIRNED